MKGLCSGILFLLLTAITLHVNMGSTGGTIGVSLVVGLLGAIFTYLLVGRVQQSIHLYREKNITYMETVSRLVAKLDERNTSFMQELNAQYSELIQRTVDQQSSFQQQMKKHLDEVKSQLEDMTDDLGDTLKRFLQQQSRTNEEVIHEMVKQLEEIAELVREQAGKQSDAVDAIRRIQNEILDLNQQDMYVMSQLIGERK